MGRISCYFFKFFKLERTGFVKKIEIQNVNKFYGKKHALKDISLTIPQGMFGLLGRNGAGKTTLMKTLAGLHQKKNGSITVCGIPIENAKEIRSMTGYLPQEFSMYPNMNVYEALDYLGTLSGMTKSDRKKRIDMLLKKVNLTEHQHKKIKALSGGMKRRLGIAQALLHDPKVLIVDEPTAGLDPEERIRFRNLLTDAAEERIVILSTHIVGDIEASCEDIAIMNDGRILWQGTVSDLIHNAEGKVFTVSVPRKFLPQIKKNYIVTGMLVQGEYTAVRMISDHMPDLQGIHPDTPNCEDAYMYCLYQNGCDVYGGDEVCCF
ncbi:MAG: ABC transporter ATP-binding protein [Oscillospiraceae bacterium]|nr:ABC transporter ATP-binding protein [Oscillospiraceae bacterium]